MDYKEIRKLRKSLEKIGPLDRVVLCKCGEVIDGEHRLRADPNWPTITLDWIDTPEKKIIARLALNWTRRKVSRDEVTEAFVKLCEMNKEEWKGHYSRELVKITGYDFDTVAQYLPPEYKQEKSIPPLYFSMPRAYIKHWLLKYGRDILETSRKVPMLSEHLSEYPKHFDNVWVADKKRPKGFGDSGFHGNTSPNLVREVLARYTEKYDLVVDNMAGSGTVMDMCVKLDRECDAYDVVPTRDDISKEDARNLACYKDNSVDFVFSHFPYHDMVDYGGDENNLSRMSAEEFLRESKKVMAEAYRILKPDKYFAVLIGDQRKEKEVIDWSAEFSKMGKELFKLHDKIIWHAKGQSAYRGSDMYDLIAAEHNFCKQVFDTLLIFKK